MSKPDKRPGFAGYPEHVRDAAATTTRCYWCRFIFIGPAGEGREMFRDHLAAAHPEILERRDASVSRLLGRVKAL